MSNVFRFRTTVGPMLKKEHLGRKRHGTKWCRILSINLMLSAERSQIYSFKVPQRSIVSMSIGILFFRTILGCHTF